MWCHACKCLHWIYLHHFWNIVDDSRASVIVCQCFPREDEDFQCLFVCSGFLHSNCLHCGPAKPDSWHPIECWQLAEGKMKEAFNWENIFLVNLLVCQLVSLSGCQLENLGACELVSFIKSHLQLQFMIWKRTRENKQKCRLQLLFMPF